MAQTRTTIKGVVHGRTIELETEPGLPDGQAVSVIVEPVVPKNNEAAFEALKRAAGSWADDPEGLEQYLEETRRQREVNRVIPD
ncbi:MAG: hypothetical protein EXR98_15860 [Gemmataceae bacterium]|nr:hypothetical protein [Gemmataceae bacterium]